MIRFFIVLSTIFIFFTKVYSQCTVAISPNNGNYTVFIRIQPVAIIPSSNNCPWGYNYNVSLNYTVSITGSNPPSGGLFTLQGNIVCNSQSLFFDLPNNGGTGNYVTTTNPFISNDGGTAYLYTTHPSCTAANVNNLNCGGVTIDINGPGLANQTINCNSSAAGPLPIELSYFTGERTKNGTLLHWETKTEKNNDLFIIEKSVDGSDWENLSEVKGAGNSLQRIKYSFTDDAFKTGINYYRIKQIDFDKRYTYSPIISILNSPGNILCSRIWPNPVSDDYSFELMAPSDGVASYNVLNELGSIIKSGRIEFNTGKNEITLSSEKYASGFHVLEIIFDENNKVYRKIVKL